MHTSELGRATLPADIQGEMNLWRLGLGELPQGYIHFHEALASLALGKLQSAGLKVHTTELVNDGWGDSMQVMRVVGEAKGKPVELRWHDGNQEFLRRLESGSIPYRPNTGGAS